MSAMHTQVARPGGGLVGGAGLLAILEWAEVFGDGGPAFQLVVGVAGLIVGIGIMVWAYRAHNRETY